MDAVLSSEMLYLPTILHGDTSKKIGIFVHNVTSLESSAAYSMTEAFVCW